MIGIATSLSRVGGSISNSNAELIASQFRDRVIADGGTLEAYSCLVSFINQIIQYDPYNIIQPFVERVLTDGGTYEADSCLYAFLQLIN